MSRCPDGQRYLNSPLSAFKSTSPIACMNGETSPVETALATVVGSLTSSQIVAPAMAAATTPMMATRLILHRATLIARQSNIRKVPRYAQVLRVAEMSTALELWRGIDNLASELLELGSEG